jgi:hypothetical protein
MDLDVAIRRVGRLYQAMAAAAQQQQGMVDMHGSWEEDGEEGGGNRQLRLEEVDRQLVVNRLLSKLEVGER